MESPTKESFSKPSSTDLQPGGISSEGFLEGDQTLEKVINRDSEALQLLGYTAQEVADLLGPIHHRANNSEKFEYAAPNGKQYNVRVAGGMGKQECPWGDEVDWRRSDGSIDMYFTEKDKNDGPTHVAGLIRHLVETHEFFEGGSYRVAPEKIVEMFGTERNPGSFKQVQNLKF